MDLSAPQISTHDTWWHYEGSVNFIVRIAPFRLVMRTKGRRISRHELIAELDYLEHDFIFAPADLADLFPVGGLLQFQLSIAGPEAGFIVASGELLQSYQQGHSLRLHLRIKRVDEDFEDFLTDLAANGVRASGTLH